MGDRRYEAMVTPTDCDERGSTRRSLRAVCLHFSQSPVAATLPLDMHTRLPSAFQPSPRPQVHQDSEGKIRNYDHERGQWTCHIYAPAGEDLVSRLADCLPTGGQSEKSYKLIPEPHLSLFRGECVVRHHHIDLLVHSLQEKLSKLHSFRTGLMHIRTLHNDASNRSFVALCAEPGSTNVHMERVLHAVRDSFRDFTDVKEYADEFIPHISIIWFLDRDDAIDSVAESLEQEFGEDPLLVRVTHVDLKIGNRDYSIPLKNS